MNVHRPVLPVSSLIQIFTFSEAAVMARFSIIVLLGVYIASAVGHTHLQLRQANGALESNPGLAPRASRDPACPEGYLCGHDSCSSNIECPGGTVCINLEGTAACAPPGLQWCALNPSTFEAVGCSVNNKCWYVLYRYRYLGSIY